MKTDSHKKGKIWQNQGQALFLILFIVLLLYLPQSLNAKKLYIKACFGIPSQLNIQDHLNSPPEYTGYVILGDQTRQKIGLEALFEFTYAFNTYLGLSLGFAYSSCSATNPQGSQLIVSGTQRTFEATPSMSLEANSIFLATTLSYPLTPSFQVNVAGGAGLYFASFKSTTRWYTERDSYGDEIESINFETNLARLGYHLNLSLDIRVSEVMFFTVDTFYRMVNFDGKKIALDTGPQSSPSFIEWVQEQNLPKFDYRVSTLSISGPSLHAGLKFRF